jgi:hypothetical protein
MNPGPSDHKLGTSDHQGDSVFAAEMSSKSDPTQQGDFVLIAEMSSKRGPATKGVSRWVLKMEMQKILAVEGQGLRACYQETKWFQEMGVLKSIFVLRHTHSCAMVCLVCSRTRHVRSPGYCIRWRPCWTATRPINHSVCDLASCCTSGPAPVCVSWRQLRETDPRSRRRLEFQKYCSQHSARRERLGRQSSGRVGRSRETHISGRRWARSQKSEPHRVRCTVMLI